MQMFNVHTHTLANHAAILAVLRHDSSQNMYLFEAINVEKKWILLKLQILSFTVYCLHQDPHFLSRKTYYWLFTPSKSLIFLSQIRVLCEIKRVQK